MELNSTRARLAEQIRGRNPNGLPVVSSAARKRLRAAAHRAAILFENDEAARLLGELRELTKSGAGADEIERFVAGVEARNGL